MRTSVVIKWAVLVLSFWVLIGCGKKSLLRDRFQDYNEASVYPNLKIPKDVHAGSFSSEYQIPGA